MSVDAVTTLLAVLSLVALTVAALVAIGLIATAFGWRGGSAVLADRRVPVVVLWLAAVTAIVAMGGSLYLSEVADYVPCSLCWYQRIAMYPLAVILTIAAVRRRPDVIWYGLPIAVIGAGISLVHLWEENYSDGPGFCSIGVPCSFKYVDEFGFVTIPFMALCAFALIGVLLVTGALASRRR
jgi:hypothetical protein